MSRIKPIIPFESPHGIRSSVSVKQDPDIQRKMLYAFIEFQQCVSDDGSVSFPVAMLAMEEGMRARPLYWNEGPQEEPRTDYWIARGFHLVAYWDGKPKHMDTICAGYLADKWEILAPEKVIR